MVVFISSVSVEYCIYHNFPFRRSKFVNSNVRSRIRTFLTKSTKVFLNLCYVILFLKLLHIDYFQPKLDYFLLNKQ